MVTALGMSLEQYRYPQSVAICTVLHLSEPRAKHVHWTPPVTTILIASLG
jgi:hypothetical protein